MQLKVISVPDSKPSSISANGAPFLRKKPTVTLQCMFRMKGELIELLINHCVVHFFWHITISAAAIRMLRTRPKRWHAYMILIGHCHRTMHGAQQSGHICTRIDVIDFSEIFLAMSASTALITPAAVASITSPISNTIAALHTGR